VTKDQIPAEDILRIVWAADDATIVAIHDRATRSLDIICTVHAAPYTHLLSRGCTKDATDRFRAATVDAADKHAQTRHTPRVATPGSQP
jgi:hypothetical protein